MRRENRRAFPWIGMIRRVAVIVMAIWPMTAGAGDRVSYTPSFRVDATYTDNLFTTPSNEEEDILTTVTPGLSIAWEAPTVGASLSWQPSFVHYQRFSEYDTWRHLAELNARYQPGRHTLFSLKNRFHITEDPSEKDSRTGNGEETDTENETRAESPAYRAEVERIRRGRDRYLTNTGNFLMTHEFSRRLSCEVSYDIDVERNEDPTIRNSLGHKPSMEWRYWLVPRQLEMTATSTYSYKDVADAIDDPGYLEERLSPGLDVVWHVLPERCQVAGGLAYIRGVSTDNEIPAVSATGEKPLADDNWYESLKASWSFSYKTERWEISASGYHERTLTYDDDGRTIPSDDYRIFHNALRVSRPFNRRLTLFMGMTYAMTRFDGEENGINEDYIVYEPSLGVRYLLTETLPVSLDLGYLIREKADGDPEHAVTLNGQLGAWKFARHGTLSFSASSGYTQDQLGPESLGFGIHYEAKADASYEFTRELAIQAKAEYRRERYLDNKDTGGEFRDDREKSVDVALVYAPLDWLNFRLGYDWHDVSASDEPDSYTENRVALMVTASPSRPWRLKK